MPAIRRIPQAEFLDAFQKQAAAGEIAHNFFSTDIARQLFLIKLGRELQKIEDALLGFLVFFFALVLRQFHPGALRQHLERFAEFQALHFHHESEHIPALAAAETVPHGLLLVHHKRRRALLMERTASLPVRSCLFQSDIRADQLYDIQPRLDFVSSSAHNLSIKPNGSKKQTTPGARPTGGIFFLSSYSSPATVRGCQSISQE